MSKVNLLDLFSSTNIAYKSSKILIFNKISSKSQHTSSSNS